MTSDTDSRTAAEHLTFADILAKAKPARRTTHLYLAGDLLARRDELEQEIDEAGRIERLTIRDTDGRNLEQSLGDAGTPTDALVAELAHVLEQLRGSRTAFTFQVLPRSQWDALRKQHELGDGRVDLDTICIPLVAASSFQPAMTEAEVDQLFEVLNHAQRKTLFDAAWAVNTGAVDVPFSPAGSAAEKAQVSARR